MPAAQIEQVDGSRRSQRGDAARAIPLIVERDVATGGAVEIVGGVQSKQIDPGLPLEDVRVDVELVAGELVHLRRPSGKTKRAVKVCLPLGATLTSQAISSRLSAR